MRVICAKCQKEVDRLAEIPSSWDMSTQVMVACHGEISGFKVTLLEMMNNEFGPNYTRIVFKENE